MTAWVLTHGHRGVHEDGTEMIQEFYYYPDLETGVFVNHALYTIEGDTISFLFANGETSVLDFELDRLRYCGNKRGVLYDNGFVCRIDRILKYRRGE